VKGYSSGRGLIRSLLAAPPAGRLWQRFLRDRITIFTLHRFAVPELGITGHTPDVLRAILARLRAERFDLIDVDTACRRLSGPDPIPDRPAVCFTVDDGYFDGAAVGAEVFLEFDCPATFFVTTGFLDGENWHWWDQVSWIVQHTGRRRFQVRTPGLSVDLSLEDGADRKKVADDLLDRCKLIPDLERIAVIRELAEQAGLDLPASPPPGYRPMKWSDARALEVRGLRFGAHGVAHRILTECEEAVSRDEIEGSWRTIRERVATPSRVFAYPNGDFGVREMRFVEEAGLDGAVSTGPGYASRDMVRGEARNRFGIPRLPFQDTPTQVYLDASGFSRISGLVRGRHL
jgi:peptidoglycan/xylan/chitin deacetylase (PgdA/CDA1 family)